MWGIHIFKKIFEGWLLDDVTVFGHVISSRKVESFQIIGSHLFSETSLLLKHLKTLSVFLNILT